MTATAAAWTRRRAAALMTAPLLAILAGCSVSTDHGVPASATPTATVGVSVVLRSGERVATARLIDTPAARQFAAMLPLTVQLKDVWGQAKSGRLPHALTVEGTIPVHDPVPGNIYFWPLSDVIAVYYDDLGQTVPDPGLVRLGVVDTGLDGLARAGKRITVRIDVAAATSS
jgi:hypothetical protein